MDLQTQFRIKSNQLYIEYLRANSHWYKQLNRHPEAIASFLDEVKQAHHLRPVDKVTNLANRIEDISNFIEILK